MHVRPTSNFLTALGLISITVSLLTCAPVRAQVGLSLPPGTLLKIYIPTTLVRPSRPGDFKREVDIYLPAAYINDVGQDLRFPVIYLLHGSPGRPTDFEKNGHWPIFFEENLGTNSLGPAILVAPDGNYNAAAYGDSEWINSYDGRDRYEDFVVDQVVPYIDSHFRTIAVAKDRIICGVSEGGFGAVNIGLHRPTVFGSILACSGYYLNDGSGWARRIMGSDPSYLAYNSPYNYVDDPNALTKYLAFWRAQHYFIGSGLDEKRYTVESAEIADELKLHDIPVVLYQTNGKHGWGLWNTLFAEGLSSLFPASTGKEAGSAAKAPIPH